MALGLPNTKHDNKHRHRHRRRRRRRRRHRRGYRQRHKHGQTWTASNRATSLGNRGPGWQYHLEEVGANKEGKRAGKGAQDNQPPGPRQRPVQKTKTLAPTGVPSSSDRLLRGAPPVFTASVPPRHSQLPLQSSALVADLPASCRILIHCCHTDLWSLAHAPPAPYRPPVARPDQAH